MCASSLTSFVFRDDCLIRSWTGFLLWSLDVSSLCTLKVLRTIVATLKGIPSQVSLVESRYIVFLYTESVLRTTVVKGDPK